MQQAEDFDHCSIWHLKAPVSSSISARTGLLRVAKSAGRLSTKKNSSLNNKHSSCWELETPCCFLPTLMGLPENLMPSQLEGFPYQFGLQLQFQDFYCVAEVLAQLKHTAAEFASVDKYCCVLSLGSQTGGDEIIEGPLYENAMSMFVSGSGFKRVELPDYVQAVKTIGSDIHTSMAVEVSGRCSERRIKRSKNLSKVWSEDFLKLTQGKDMGASLCVLVGGSSADDYADCAKEVSHSAYTGFYIGGLGYSETLDERAAFLKSANVTSRIATCCL